MSGLVSEQERKDGFWEGTYNSCNVIVISILLGLRQHLSEGVIDTKITWFEGTIKIYFKYLPQTYILICFGLFILFGVYFDIRLFFAFFNSWFYLRYFMRNELTKTYGDPSNSFAFAMFFPERIRPPFEKCSESIYKLVDKIGLVSLLSIDRIFKNKHNPMGGTSEIER